MRVDLTALARRALNPRRSTITIRDIVSPSVLATDLYQAGYAQMVTVWGAAADRVLAEYERTLSTLTTDAPADIQSILEQAEGELSRLFLLLKPRLTNWAFRVEKWQRGKWIGAVLAASKVDLSTMLGPEDARDTLGTAIERNVALVKDVSSQARGRISEAVFRGLTERRPARDVAVDVRAAVSMAKDRSVRIASDQLTKVTAALASERRREAGLDSWAWVSSHKKHFRPAHAARDGKVYTDKTAPEDLPGRLPFCGCRERAVIRFD